MTHARLAEHADYILSAPDFNTLLERLPATIWVRIVDRGRPFVRPTKVRLVAKSMGRTGAGLRMLLNGKTLELPYVR